MNRGRTLKAAVASAAAAIVAPAVASAAGNPDAELIAMCGRFVLLQAQYEAAYKVPGLTIETEERIDVQTAPLEAEAQDLLDRITRMNAETPAGVAAIARAAHAYADPRDLDPTNERLYLCDRLNALLIRDAGRLA